MTAAKVLTVLLVEDNPGDVDLVLDALRDSQLAPRVTVAVDGVDALAQLRAGSDLPDLILMDLNLPKKDGRAVLREMKADARLRQIPIVMLSSSAAERDVADTYELGANCFVTKPADVDDFFAAVRAIEQFWLKLVKLPPTRRSFAIP